MKDIAATTRRLKKLLTFSLEADRRLTLEYYATAALGALAPVGAGVAIMYLIDAFLVPAAGGTPSLPWIVVVVLAARSLLIGVESFVTWHWNRLYVDFLLRWRLQNALNLQYFSKLANLDLAHLEDPEVQNLLTKARDTFPWRVPDFVRLSSYFFSALVTWGSIFAILSPFGWWIPVAITLASVPRLWVRTRWGNFQWSIYGSGAPNVKRLWYFMWILSWPPAIREARIHGASWPLLEKFKETQKSLFDLNRVPLDRFMRLIVFPILFETGVLFAIAVWKAPDVLVAAMTLGAFTLLVNLLDRMGIAMVQIVTNLGQLHENGLYVDHFFEVLALPKIVTEAPDAVELSNTVPPRIVFQNVHFAYPNGREVLHDVSFTIEPGEKFALVGPNGAGKTTIVKLLCRFYDPTGGRILVNGIDLRNLRLENWYRHLGTLFQDIVQFHFSVRENIFLGDPTRTDETRMRLAAERSGAAAFIEGLPKKYDQALGRQFEEGEELSTGQWQKLSIARAFYREAPILILDEPTSAVDAEAEFEIFNHLEKAYEDKTVVLISHRFSTVRNADRIVVLDEGRIIERGSHEDLLALDGRYAGMFKTQARGYT